MPEIIYQLQTQDFLIVAWAFHELDTTLSNKEKSNYYKNFLRTELQHITHNPSCKLYYNDNNKPFINDPIYQSISISHTQHYLAIQLHRLPIAGIDIESERPALLKIQHKFLTNEEIPLAQHTLSGLCILWTAKEALFKIHGIANISLKKNIRILEVNHNTIHAVLIHNRIKEHYLLQRHSFNEYLMHLTYVVKKN